MNRTTRVPSAADDHDATGKRSFAGSLRRRAGGPSQHSSQPFGTVVALPFVFMGREDSLQRSASLLDADASVSVSRASTSGAAGNHGGTHTAGNSLFAQLQTKNRSLRVAR